MTKVTISSAASVDLTAALDWYDEQAPSIGPKFLAELQTLLTRIRANPRQFPLVRGDTRRASFTRFPYGLFFQIRDDRVLIIACLHARRVPSRWQNRE